MQAAYHMLASESHSFSSAIELIQPSKVASKHAGPLRKEVAERNRQVAQDRARLRPHRRAEVEQILFHISKEERRHHHPSKGILRTRILQRRATQRSNADSSKSWGALPGQP